MPSARELYLATDHVIGQTKARKQLAVLMERQQMVAAGILDHAAGAIIGGNTGAGKTYLVREMCRLAGVPFAETNATQYTEAGYVGLNLTQMFLPLLDAAAKMIDEKNGNEKTSSTLEREDIKDVIDLASVGVVFLDEFDKWCLSGTDSANRNVGKKLQAELLKLVEGSTEYVSDDEDELGISFDTSKVLVICCGAFVGLQAYVARRLDREMADEGLWDLIEPSDFIWFGLLPELAGRLSTHIFVRPLREEHLAEIMTRPGGQVEEYRQRFEAKGVEWAIPDVALRYIARQALRRGTGARGIEHVMWQTFDEALFAADEGRQVTYSINDPKAVVA